MRRHLKLILAVLTICHLPGCTEASPEAKIRKAFDACVTALEGRDAAGATEPLSRDFQGPEGLDKPGARLYLMGLLKREKIGVTVLGNRVEVKGKEAHQMVELVLTSKGESVLPQDATHRTYRLRWRLEGKDWRLWRFEEAR